MLWLPVGVAVAKACSSSTYTLLTEALEGGNTRTRLLLKYSPDFLSSLVGFEVSCVVLKFSTLPPESDFGHGELILIAF